MAADHTDHDPAGFAGRLTGAVNECCGGLLLGSYLHGSAALGGWNARRSDVDVLFVAAGDVSAETALTVGSTLLRFGADCPGRGLEASLVTAAQAAGPADPWPFAVHVAVGAGGQTLKLGTEVAGDPDLIMHYAVCRAAGKALLGPEPPEVIGAVPRPVILAYLAAELDWGLANGTLSYSVLNACRAAEFLTTGRIVSKLAGGAAAVERGDAPSDLVREALDQQRGLAQDRPPGPEAIAFVRGVGVRLAAAARAEQADSG
jgi:hypothetical protein